MNIKFSEFHLIILYSFIQLISTEDSKKNYTSQLSENNCSLLSDCFNCSIIPTCRWNSSEEKCIHYNNLDYSLPIINHSISNITILNKYFNFIRNACFLSKTPMINNYNNSKNYNFESIKYCGEHYIMTSEIELENNFKIELNNFNGSYGTPNLLCEYIFFSGPDSFDLNININQKESNKFYLLYSKDSINFTMHINSSTILELKMTKNKLNTFLFYATKSFDSPPFTITYESNFWSKAVQATGYIMLALIIVIIAIIIFAIIYMRKNSSLFKKKKKGSKKDSNKNKNIFDKSKAEEISLMKRRSNETNPTGPSLIRNFTPETPINFLEKKFSFEKCAYDGNLFSNKEDIYEAKCGHLYHKNCYNKLLKESKDIKELKCIICDKNI